VEGDLTQDKHANYLRMTYAQLLDHVSEQEATQRGPLASYLLGSSRHDVTTKTIMWAAIAALASALGALIQAGLAILSYLHPGMH